MTTEIYQVVMSMSDSELLLWHEMGGWVPDNHPRLFKLHAAIARIGDENGTRNSFPVPAKVAAVAARKAVG
jgi:hypothetical protein